MNIRINHIGGGGFGKVERVELPYADDGCKIEHSSFYVKKTFQDNESGTAEENARRAVENFELAKSSGLKLRTNSYYYKNVDLSMYKLESDGITVRMSDVETNGWRIVNKQTRGVDQKYKKSLRLYIDIHEWKSLIERVFLQSITAAERQVELNPHCFFYLSHGNDRVAKNMDFIIGDFDGVKKVANDKEEIDRVKHRNFYAAFNSLLDIAYDHAINVDECEIIANKEFDRYSVRL
jgi:hypothetical protein